VIGRRRLGTWILDTVFQAHGRESPAGKIVHLGTIGDSDGSKPESIAVLKEVAGAVESLLFRDGAA
jgi:hypothetical protein